MSAKLRQSLHNTKQLERFLSFAFDCTHDTHCACMKTDEVIAVKPKNEKGSAGRTACYNIISCGSMSMD